MSRAEITTPEVLSDESVVELSPFTVNAQRDNGFMDANAGTATRLSLDMKDVPAPYSVMTRDFIDRYLKLMSECECRHMSCCCSSSRT